MKKFRHIKNFIFPETREKLECSLDGCGHENVTGTNYRHHGLKRGSYEVAIWQYTISGCGIYEFAGHKYTVAPGQAFIALVPENHIYYMPKTSENWEFLFLTLEGANSIKLFKEYRQRYGSIIDYASDSEVVKSAWHIYNSSKNNQIECAYQLSSLTYNFLMQMFTESRFTPDTNRNIPAWVQQVKEYCAKNISSDIMLEDMAKIANCSKWHFSRRFADYEGMSPHRYLVELRLKFAVQLLENSTLSLKEIAEKCGFYDLTYFGKVFKAHMGMPPKKYRK